MREKILFLFVFLFLLDIVYAAPNVEISEIMYDPTNIVSGAAKDAFRCVNDSSCQWIELHNKENTVMDLSTLYGNKDGIWNSNVDGFIAADSDIPFIKTPNVGPDGNPDVEIRLLDGGGSEVNIVFFQAHFNGPTYFVQ